MTVQQSLNIRLTPQDLSTCKDASACAVTCTSASRGLHFEILDRGSYFCLYSEQEAFTAVTMKNVVLWDIETQFVLHRRHITSPLQSSAS
jgi:hypothetical protein